jgi:hypothetical protein|tara:strand:- start:948 stop:1118 length:171 start_codon:yes stop_codon:yes gene_type:complete
MDTYRTKKQKENALKAIWSKTTRLFSSGFDKGTGVFTSNDVLAIEKILLRAHKRLK